MKRKVIISIILFLSLIGILSISKWFQTNQDTGNIATPNLINLYYNGEQKQIAKNSGIRNGSGEDVFKVICDLVDFNMPNEVAIDNSSILSETSDEIVEAKEDAVGFLYNKSKKITVNSESKDKMQYNEILIILSGRYKDNVYIKIKDNSYLFVGVLNNLSYINKNFF